MAQIFVFGHVKENLLVKKSQKGSEYVCFHLKEHTGNGRTQTYQVWAWGEDVSRLVRFGVKEGSLIWLTGAIQLVDCTDSHGKETVIPDYVFEAILRERQVYEKNKNRRPKEFQDLDYICCSSYGRARSKGFHWKYYKWLLAENGLPDIRWHDLRSTYCTLLLKESFNPKAVSKLMGHAGELITMDVYGDNKGIIADGVPEIEEYMKEVLPNPGEKERFKRELLEIMIDVTEFFPGTG